MEDIIGSGDCLRQPDEGLCKGFLDEVGRLYQNGNPAVISKQSYEGELGKGTKFQLTDGSAIVSESADHAVHLEERDKMNVVTRSEKVTPGAQLEKYK